MPAVEELLRIMAALRDRESGCPWDQQQTHHSLIPYLLEESHEVIDAIEQGQPGHLRDELGDLLFQVVFHARLAEEAGQFGFEDIASTLKQKLIRRHPHVFAAVRYANDAERDQAWETQKHREQKQQADGCHLDGIPANLPALMRAEKLQKRAATVGFDWPDARPVIDKIHEELEEVLEAISENEGQDRIEEEIGDLLFVVANLARHAGVKPENALRKTNKKFIHRFKLVEQGLQQRGITLEDANLEQMETCWQEAKEMEKSSETPN